MSKVNNDNPPKFDALPVQGWEGTLRSALERVLTHLRASMAGRAHANADEAIAEAERALTTPSAEPPRETQWMPIETAPRTGESILIGHGNAVWEDYWWTNVTSGNWYECHAHGDHFGEIPSHWMPLPPCPSLQN